jgi:NAD(P)-dependent dehydrogenase (short-subunit alcohol dehydrogenase family)
MKTERILITGTSSGVGRALLEHYVGSGAQVISVNRRRVPELEARFPSVRFECVDVRSSEQVSALLRALVDQSALPECLILNAGINLIDNDASFDLAKFRSVMETNLYGVLNFVEPLTRLPFAEKRLRRVIAVSSMASYVGNPYGLGYHTSKRALSACFDVWSKMYAGTDLVFQQVMLGPVRTPMYTMAAQLPRWMVRIKDSLSASPEGTARAIVRFSGSRRQKLFYPWTAVPLYCAIWLGQAVIPGFFRGQKTLNGKTRRGAERGTAHE